MLARNKKQLGKLQMSRSELKLRIPRELQAEMRKTEIALESGKNLFMGLCNQLYPLLVFEKLWDACQQVISAISGWLFKGFKIYRLLFFLQAVAKLTAIYSKFCRIEALEQSMVKLFR